MSDQFAWWKAALGGNRGPIHDGDPQSGFYETRSKSKATGEVKRGVIAYWIGEDGKHYCREGNFMLEEMRANDRWPFASKRPITKSVYDLVIAGKGWPDENRAASADRRIEHSHADQRNDLDDADPTSFEGIKDRIDDLSREAERLIGAGAAKSQETSDQAADLADRLRKLEKLADETRSAEKKPHDDAGKVVQAKWVPLVTKADNFKAQLKAVVVTPFLTAEAAKAKAAQAAAIQAGKPPEAAASAPTRAGTTSSVGLRTTRSAAITDWPKALAYFANNQKVKDLIQQLADAAIRQGTTPDGCEIHEEQKAA